MKEDHFIKGVLKNEADRYDNYEDVVSEKIKKEVVDQSPTIDELMDNKNVEVEESNHIEYEHVGPEADKYSGMSAEEIDEQIHEQLKSQYPDQYPEYINSDVEGLRNAIAKAYEQEEVNWSDKPLKIKNTENTSNRYSGKDNLKTIPENKKQRGFRGLLRRLFKTEAEFIPYEEQPTFEELLEEDSNVDVQKITKGVLSKEELKKEELNQDQAA